MFIMAIVGAAANIFALFLANSISTTPARIVRPIPPESGISMPYKIYAPVNIIHKPANIKGLMIR